MAKFNERLNEAMNKANINATELCRRTGIPKSAVSQYRKGMFTPKSERIALLAKALNVTEAWLMGYDVGTPIDYISSINAPLYASVSAGFGRTDEEYIGTFPCVVTNQDEARNTLCAIVSGDSMSPKIENGDIIQIRKQSSVDSGDLAVVLIEGTEHFVKKVEYGVDYIRLISLNDNYKPIIFKGADVQKVYVEGKVMAIVKRC